MQCWHCLTCDVGTCPHGPLLHIRITADGQYPDPNIKPDGDQPMRRLHKRDIVVYEAEYARSLVEQGKAEFYEVVDERAA